MKKTISMALMAVLMLVSCNNDADIDANLNTKQVTFSCGYTDLQVMSRATLTEASLTDLYIYEGTTLLKHQMSTDTDFGSPTISLMYGSHALTFVASKATGQALTNGVWSCTKVADTFAKAQTITVDGSASSFNVELTRRVSAVQIKTTDKVPTTVSKVHYKIGSHKSLSAALAGGDAFTLEGTDDISSYQKKTWTHAYYIMPESASEEEDCSVVVEFLGAGDAVLYHYERTVKVKVNRVTSISGEYFSDSGNTVSVVTDWDTMLDVPLFSE